MKAIDEHVQNACTSGHTGIARVSVLGDVGYWYFRRGVIIHAATLDLVGEEAALRMLSWDDGQWEPCTRPWPSEQSVFLSWVELFQRAGERHRAASPDAEPPNVTLAQVRASQSRSAASYRRAPSLSVVPPGADSHPSQAFRSELPTLSAAQLESLADDATQFVVVENDGRSRTLRGNSEMLVELTSYASQLCEGIGSELGSGHCHALEVAYRAHTLIVARRGTITLGLTIPRDAGLDRIRTKLRI